LIARTILVGRAFHSRRSEYSEKRPEEGHGH
jgi:hypothetical protein